MASITDILPALYTPLFPESLRLTVPEEKKATCGNCAMCDTTTQVRSVDGRPRAFRPDTKCCTYQPKLPNYLVGAILADTSPEMAEGRARILERVRAGIGATPLGLNPPARYSLLYANARDFFGKSIWKYREAVCSTWYCKYDAGADGRKFWTSLKKVLSLGEIQLSRFAALRLHRDFILQERDRDAAGTAVTLAELEERAESEEARFEMWGLWFGREEEFYLRCYEEVVALNPIRFRELMGLDGEIWEAILLESHRQVREPKMPHRLRFNPEATVQRLPDGTVALGAYSEYDAVAVPKLAYELVSEVTAARTLDETRASWRENHRADLSDEMLLQLFQHRILIQA
jgi:hypothetical protein